jgi:hypothetical protein
MLLIERRMHELGWSFSITRGSGDDVYYAEFTKRDGEYVHTQEWHADAGTATGQSALFALGVLK